MKEVLFNGMNLIVVVNLMHPMRCLWIYLHQERQKPNFKSKGYITPKQLKSYVLNNIF